MADCLMWDFALFSSYTFGFALHFLSKPGIKIEQHFTLHSCSEIKGSRQNVQINNDMSYKSNQEDNICMCRYFMLHAHS